MLYVNLTDDELWRAIAENTSAMSRLLYQQLEFDAYIGPNDPYRHLMRFYLERANKFQRQYQDYTAELRRRYPLRVKTYASSEAAELPGSFGFSGGIVIAALYSWLTFCLMVDNAST